MILLPTINQVAQIEAKLNREFPKCFKAYISQHQYFTSNQFVSNEIHFIKNIHDIKKFSEQSGYPPSSLLLFFVDKTNQDYYCFDTDEKVVAYSVHTIVHEWKDFECWLKWCIQKPKDMDS